MISAPSRRWKYVLMISTDPSWAEWSRCTILDRVWHKSLSLPFCSVPLGEKKNAFAKILQLKRLISVSITMASCCALLPTESQWNQSATSTCINALFTIPIWESHCHYLMLFQGNSFALPATRGNQ